MSFVERALAYLRPRPGKSDIKHNLVVPNVIQEAGHVRTTLPEPRTHQDFVKRESRINCLMFAHAHRVELARCFMEVDKREIMADFVSKCQNASTCELWDRMGKVCEALRDALLEISIATGGQYQELRDCIINRALAEAYRPKKRRHWAYDTSTIAAELTRLSLTRAMDDLVLMAEDLL